MNRWPVKLYLLMGNNEQTQVRKRYKARMLNMTTVEQKGWVRIIISRVREIGVMMMCSLGKDESRKQEMRLR